MYYLQRSVLVLYNAIFSSARIFVAQLPSIVPCRLECVKVSYGFMGHIMTNLSFVAFHVTVREGSI